MACLAGGGEMGALMRAHDWAKTRLGSVEHWSPALRTTLSLLLANRFPMLLWWGPDSISLYNDAYIPVLGVKHPAALGMPVRECWSEIYDVLEPLIVTPLSGGPATWSEDLALEIRRHGFLEETHWTVAYSPVPDETAPNGIGGVLATVHEITAQVVGDRRGAVLSELGSRLAEAKSAEAACALAAEVFAGRAKDVPFARIYLLDESGRSARLAGAAGIDEGESCSPKEIDLTTEGDGSWCIGKVVRTATPELVERVRTGATDRDLPRRTLVMPIESSLPHELAGVLVVGLSPVLELDASYRRFIDLATTQLSRSIANARAYEAERRRAETLAELDRAKTTFFNNVSHELRTPLTLILGPVQELLESALSHGQREQLETVQRNGLRLLRLINSLLDVSRIEAGRVQPHFERVDVGSFSAELASLFRSLIERAGLKLSIDCPALSQPIFIDRQMWEKIVLNLVSNAFKFTFEGEISVRVEVDERSLRLIVRDTGTGIDAQHLPHLFERFYRAQDARGRTHEGTGIGLALVRELAKLHGGEVSVESRRGQGSTFVVSIPLQRAPLPSEQELRAAPPAAAHARPYVDEAASWLASESDVQLTHLALSVRADAPLEAAHILVVDDNLDMRAYLERLLRVLGTVTAVADGRQALAAIERRLPDLVLSDVMMPNLDGLGLVRALRADERTKTLPIVLISARVGEEARVEAASAAADDYIVKPFTARELLVRLRSQLQLARLRREHAEALRKSEERFRALVMASSDAIYQLSPDWSEMLHLHGRDVRGFIAEEEPRGSWLQRYIHPDEQPQITALIQAAIRTQSPFELEHRVVRGDDSPGWMFSRAVPVKNDKGEIREWFGAATDITERKRVEQALQQANLELAEADRHKNEFLAVLSHELRNPLAPISNSIYLLQHGLLDAERVKHAVSVIERQTGLLARLVDDLLDVTRISRGKIQLQRQRLELNELVRRTLEDQRSLFDKAGLRVALQLARQPIVVDADANRMAQAIGNLLQNAAKFTPLGGEVSIRVDVDANARWASIQITDTGMGIAPEMVARLFQPFVQADRTLDRSKGGLGLGLALVKGIVELHGGEVAARSAGFGAGSEFVLRLPMGLHDAAQPGPHILAAKQRRRRVLIIEDNEDAADTLCEVLASRDHHVEVAYDGPEGLAKAREFQPEIVLCDIGLPDMDGYEVARAFRADGAFHEVFLVALTGYALPEDMQRATAAGFQRHLAKPPNLEKLEQVLAEAKQ